MLVTKSSGKLGRLVDSGMPILLVKTIWSLAVYWSIVGDSVAPVRVPNNLLQQARDLLQGIFIAPLIIMALWPLVHGGVVDISEGRRRRFVGVLSLFVLVNLILEAIERKFPFLGIAFLASVFSLAVVVLVRNGNGATG